MGVKGRGSKRTPRRKGGRAEIVQVIRGIWDSLDSHLDLAVAVPKRACSTCGDRKHHRECVIEYAEMILKLSRQI